MMNGLCAKKRCRKTASDWIERVRCLNVGPSLRSEFGPPLHDNQELS